MSKRWLRAAFAVSLLAAGTGAEASGLADVQMQASSGRHLQAIETAFRLRSDASPETRALAAGWIAHELVRAGLPHAAVYFFVEALESRSSAAIQRALAVSEALLFRVGVDALRDVLIARVKPGELSARSRASYSLALGKRELLAGRYSAAQAALAEVDPTSPLFPAALQLRATARVHAGDPRGAQRDFARCAREAERYSDYRFDGVSVSSFERSIQAQEMWDLTNRCRAGRARVLYERERFEEAEAAYDEIDRRSLVWPDILFEQAWNAFAKDEFNRTLGKLVTYKSPALRFVFNSEIEILRAQTYLTLCLYDDASATLREFEARYAPIGVAIKRWLETRGLSATDYFRRGKQASLARLTSPDPLDQVLSRFVRSPYFQGLKFAEASVAHERRYLMDWAKRATTQLPAFALQTLATRARQIEQLGGAYVKNSLLDHYEVLLGHLDQASFIKLEMLSRSKQRVLQAGQSGALASERTIGVREPLRRDHQYQFGFNGEFWSDELGDYVFGLESQCGKSSRGVERAS